MCIIDLDYSRDVVTASTASGYTYQFTGCSDYYTGDLVALIMDDNGTPDDIADDKVISNRYSGFWITGPTQEAPEVQIL